MSVWPTTRTMTLWRLACAVTPHRDVHYSYGEIQKPNDGSNCSAFLHGETSYGVVSSISGDGTPQSALVGIAISPDRDYLRHREVFPEISIKAGKMTPSTILRRSNPLK